MVGPVRDWTALERVHGTNTLYYVQFAISFRLILVFVPSSSKPCCQAGRDTNGDADWRHWLDSKIWWRDVLGARQTKSNSDSFTFSRAPIGSQIVSLAMKRKMLQTKVSTLISSSLSSSLLVPALDLQQSFVPFKCLIESANMYEHFSDNIANRFSMNPNENWLSNVFRDFRNSFRAVGFGSEQDLTKGFSSQSKRKDFSLSSSFHRSTSYQGHARILWTLTQGDSETFLSKARPPNSSSELIKCKSTLSNIQNISYAKISDSGDFYGLANSGFTFIARRSPRNQELKIISRRNLQRIQFEYFSFVRRHRSNEEWGIRLMAFIDSS